MEETETFNVDIWAGALWEMSAICKDDSGSLIDFTGYTAYCQIRTAPDGTLLASPTMTITVGTAEIKAALTAAQTILLGAGNAVYDVLIKKVDEVRYMWGGEIEIKKVVTVIA